MYYKFEMAKTTDRWLLYTCVKGQITPLSTTFKTKKLAEKARLKLSGHARGQIGVGLIRQPAKAKL